MEPRRKKNGTFQKGETGNKGGRPKGVAQKVREMSNDYDDYLEMLDKWARDEKLPVKTRKECIIELLDRSLGRSTQHIDNTILMPEPIQYVPYETDKSN